MTDSTTAEDRALLQAISDEPDELRKLNLINEYWTDQERKERTSPDWLIFHCGMLSQSKLGPLWTAILEDVLGRKTTQE